ncbi:Imm26 family immunity protein [Cohnella sp. 56]|uniref:Imm26 family immunity protein n=1 Tax=Cohnella sp. 56 TaxID=3113722 RepID=UPI0030E8EB9F
MKINPGQIVEINLTADGHKGYGRIIKKKGFEILIELYRIIAERTITISELKNLEPLSYVWTVTHPILEGRWPIIYSLDLPEKFKMPVLWQPDYLDERFIYLFVGDEQTRVPREKRGNASPNGTFFEGALKIHYLTELQKQGLYSGDIPEDSLAPALTAKIEDDELVREIYLLYNKFRGRQNSTPETVTARLLKDYNRYLEDEDDQITVYLGIALAQLKHGELLAEIKEKALLITKEGLGLNLWSTLSPEIFEERKNEYALLEEKLRSWN